MPLMPRFHVGDVVRLKSGGMPMTVEGYSDSNHHQAKVVWFDSAGKPQRETYPEDTLEKIEATYS
ncbi:MAG: DUF2158 domain-containing protein [Elusimicrobia bacterium]|jgi:uncharacterized protein YodC (DUF2158 family)|nr:DUF2158 domain-containing protein [Elusimicrobiota bacterium]